VGERSTGPDLGRELVGLAGLVGVVAAAALAGGFQLGERPPNHASSAPAGSRIPTRVQSCPVRANEFCRSLDANVVSSAPRKEEILLVVHVVWKDFLVFYVVEMWSSHLILG
jgi:hypothetical protein